MLAFLFNTASKLVILFFLLVGCGKDGGKKKDGLIGLKSLQKTCSNGLRLEIINDNYFKATGLRCSGTIQLFTDSSCANPASNPITASSSAEGITSPLIIPSSKIHHSTTFYIKYADDRACSRFNRIDFYYR